MDRMPSFSPSALGSELPGLPRHVCPPAAPPGEEAASLGLKPKVSERRPQATFALGHSPLPQNFSDRSSNKTGCMDKCHSTPLACLASLV